MQDDKAVIFVVVVGDDMGKIHPQARRHVATVNRWIELVGGDMGRHLLQFGYVAQKVLKVERFQGSGERIAAHADGSARINDKNLAFVRHRLRDFCCKNT